MIKEKLMELITKKSENKTFFSLDSGDVFVSIHFKNSDCLGFVLLKNDLSKYSLEVLFDKILKLHHLNDIIHSEWKIIGMASAITLVENYLKSKKCIEIKRVEREEKFEVIFSPLENKVRVTKVSDVSPLPQKLLRKYKVLIVDDSKTIRTILAKIFSSDPEVEVCAMAEKPSEVEALIIKHRPDVVTLDIHMPEMDGVTLLKIIAPKYHIPTIMISSISMAEGPLVLEALEHGALDYIQKPEASEMSRVTPIILEKVKMAAMSNISKSRGKKIPLKKPIGSECDLSSLIVLGSSTGGTEAIRDIITALPAKIPPMLIVQHIPAVFSAAFAKRMDDLCPFEVKEAEDGDEVRNNRILIAPGGKQMKFLYKNGKATVEINNDDPVNRFKPSVDYLFLSVSKNIYTHTIGVILTGMGKDGAKGMLELRKLGVRTIAQDESTSVVFGMPKEAIALGGAEFVVPLQDIAEKIVFLTNDKIKHKKVS